MPALPDSPVCPCPGRGVARRLERMLRRSASRAPPQSVSERGPSFRSRTMLSQVAFAGNPRERPICYFGVALPSGPLRPVATGWGRLRYQTTLHAGLALVPNPSSRALPLEHRPPVPSFQARDAGRGGPRGTTAAPIRIAVPHSRITEVRRLTRTQVCIVHRLATCRGHQAATGIAAQGRSMISPRAPCRHLCSSERTPCAVLRHAGTEFPSGHSRRRRASECEPLQALLDGDVKGRCSLEHEGNLLLHVSRLALSSAGIRLSQQGIHLVSDLVGSLEYSLDRVQVDADLAGGNREVGCDPEDLVL